MRGQSFYRTSVVFFLLVLFYGTGFSGAPPKQLTPEKKFLQDASVKIAERLFGQKDADECKSFLKQANKAAKPKFALVYVRYLRIMEKDSVKALGFLGPWLIDKSRIADWQKAQAEGEKAALAKWREEMRGSDAERRKEIKNHPPIGLFASYPKPTEWKIDENNADLAIEIARCHMDLHAYQDTLAIIDILGQKFTDETRVLSAECGGDLMVQMQMYQKSIDFYGFALNVLNSLKSMGEGFTPEQKIIHDRIQRSLAEAKRLLEIEQYGAGWVAYRDAEQKRRGENAYLEAYLMYESIRRDFPKTVYSEAATCYGVKCLLALAEEENAKKAQETIAQAEKRLSDETTRVDKLKSSDVPKATLKEMKQELKGIQVRIEQMKAVPTGPMAFIAAEKGTGSMLAEFHFGLYRGELLVAIGDYFLEKRLDPDEAEKMYLRASEWLEGVKNADAQLQAFEVPGKAREVSAPPEASFQVDHWGNVQDADIRIGQIVNRRTCRWYLDDLRARTFSQLGFFAFMDGNMEAARANFQKMADADMRVQYLQRKQGPNMYRRLMARCDQSAFRRSSPDDLKCFKSRQRRYVIYLADFDAESERPVRAEKLYRRLLVGEFGRLSPEEEAYTRFGLSWVLWYDGVYSGKETAKTEAKSLLSKFVDDPQHQKFSIAPRALNTLANMLSYGAADERIKSLNIYRLVVKAYSQTKHAETALYRLGVTCAQSKDEAQRTEAIQSLQKLISKYGKSQYTTLAKELLTKLKEKEDS